MIHEHDVTTLPMPPAADAPQAGPVGEHTQNLGVYVHVRPALRRPDATGEIPRVPAAAPVALDQRPAVKEGLIARLRRLRANGKYRGRHRAVSRSGGAL